jgi:asparagine synthase (glutamine-hydrolysing)
MCGIATLIRFGATPVDAAAIGAMAEAVRHRGPDSAGVAYLAAENGRVEDFGSVPRGEWNVALGFRRLSIIDLSEAGSQPMSYRGRLWIVFNGEIYNYVELREELLGLGHEFRSHSDTEVILAAYDEWGTDCFARLRGMWGLVLIDGPRGRAIFSRDRLGIKPLYLAQVGGLLAAGSEIKQFLSVSALRLRPDESVLVDYLTTGYEQQGATFFHGVEPMAPGTWLSVDLQSGRRSEPQRYWFPERIEVSIDDADEAARLLGEALRDSVRVHLRSDVPVGCALSGGLDSSSIAACVGQLTEGSAQRFETFSVVFPGCPTDENAFAREVAASVRSSAHYVTPTPQQFLDDVDRLLWIHDEPVGSLAQYAAYVLARITREAGVPVTLNGQGGDEVLGGYWQSYFMHLRGLFQGGRLLRLSRHLAGAVLPGGNRELPRQAPLMLRRYRARHQAAASAGNGTARAKLRGVMEMTERERRIFEIREMYLPRLLKWDDRNFMAFSVEGRYPLLDHPLIELALSFAPGLLYRRGWTKEPLRRAMDGMLPRSIVRRRTKWGFETPQDAWLCGELRKPFEAWLTGDAPLWQFVDRAEVRRLAEEVWGLEGRRDEPGQALLRLFLADRWMRVFFN